MKRQRILTNRDFSDEAYECIEMEEIDGKQYLYHRMIEKGEEGCFPVSVDYAQDKFKEFGREYRVSGKEVAKTYVDLLVDGQTKTNYTFRKSD